MQDNESFPKDKLEAIKIKSELITTKIGILSSGIVGNIKEIASDKEKYSGHPPGISGPQNKSKHKNNNTRPTKTVVLRKDKPRGRLLPKSSSRTSKTSRHNETTRNDAISDTTTESSSKEEGY